MEEDIFPHPAVAGILENDYVEARIHTDHPSKGEAQRELQMEMVGFVAAPYYLIIDPATGMQIGSHRLEGVSDGWDTIRDKFADFLESPPAAR